jgi:hypothetical protein
MRVLAAQWVSPSRGSGRLYQLVAVAAEAMMLDG